MLTSGLVAAATSSMQVSCTYINYSVLEKTEKTEIMKVTTKNMLSIMRECLQVQDY